MRASDTSAAAARLQAEILRDRGEPYRLAFTLALTRLSLESAQRALAEAHPDEAADQLKIRFVALHYGQDLADKFAADLRARKLVD